MTAQIPDFFVYRNNKYNVVGLNGKGLLLPQDFNMFPINFSTACLRGYYIEYACIEENLILTALSLQLDKDDEYKEVEGVFPVGDTDNFFDVSDGIFFLYKYRNLKIPIPYSGGFLIAKDFVSEMRATEIPQSYKSVFELLFDNGKLKKIIDWSELIAREREEALANKPDYFKVEFSLKYIYLYFHQMSQYAL